MIPLRLICILLFRFFYVAADNPIAGCRFLQSQSNDARTDAATDEPAAAAAAGRTLARLRQRRRRRWRSRLHGHGPGGRTRRIRTGWF